MKIINIRYSVVVVNSALTYQPKPQRQRNAADEIERNGVCLGQEAHAVANSRTNLPTVTPSWKRVATTPDAKYVPWRT